MKRGIRTVLLACGLGVVGCGSPGSAPPPRQLPPVDTNPDGFGLVIVTDTSGSMDNNDPRGFNKEGAHLAVGLTDARDNLGLVSFSSKVQTNEPLRAMRTGAQRTVLGEAIDGLRNRGKTNFIDALTAARDQLDAPGLSEDAAVILLSDGQHNPDRPLIGSSSTPEEDRATIEGLAGELADRGARVFTVALGDEIEPTMQQIAAASGGAAYQVPNADDLVDAYLEILGDVYGLFQYYGGVDEVNVSSTSRRLIYLLVKPRGNRGTGFDGRIQHRGQAVDLSSRASYRRPPSSEASFDVVQFSDDLAGPWSCNVPAGAGKVIVLTNVPVQFGLVSGTPAAEVQEGHLVKFAIEAVCDDVGVARDAEGELSVLAKIEADGREVGEVALSPRREGSTITYTGSLTATRTGVDDGPEPQLARFEIRLGDAGWVHKKTASFTVVPASEPPPPPVFEADDFSIGLPSGSDDLGDHWLGEVRFDVPLTVRNDHTEAISVTFATDGVVARPADISVAPGGEQRVSLKPGKLSNPGSYSGSITASASAGGASATSEIEVSVDVFDIRMGAVTPAEVAAGFDGQLRVPVQVAPRGTSFEVRGVAVGEGPDGVEPEWPDSIGAALSVPLTVPTHTPGGRYAAELSVRPAGTSMAVRKLPVAFSVSASAPALEVDMPAEFEVSLSAPGFPGWVALEPAVSVELAHHQGLDLEMNLSSLDGEGQSFKDADLRLVGTNTLAPGQAQEVQLEINLSAQRKVGTYRGTLTLAVFDGSLDDMQELEIVLKVVP